MEDRLKYLESENKRLEAENRSLKLQNKQLLVQHDFAFRSWHQAIKRQGALSAELAHTHSHSQVALIARAETTPLPGPMPELPNIAAGSRGDVQTPPRGTLAYMESKLTVIRRRPPRIVAQPPPIPEVALAMPVTRVQTHPHLRKRP